MTDNKAALLAEAAEIAMHHPSKDAKAFACAVSDYLLATPPAVMPAAPSDAVLQLLNHIEDVVGDEAWERIDHKLWNAVTSQYAALSQTMQSLGGVDQRALEVAASFIQLHAPDSPLYGDLRSIAARIQPAAAGEQAGAVAYLMTRPSGFSWPLMPKDVTPAWREVCKADGVTITPLGPLAAPGAAIAAREQEG